MQITPIPIVLLCGLCLAPRAAAQRTDPYAPAPEVKAFAPLVGTWAGSGVLRPDPTRPDGKWTSRTTYRWTLGGHFLREDTRVESTGMPGAMQFTAYYGWDRERQRHVSYTVNNGGAIEMTEVHWMDSQTMVTSNQRAENGMPSIDRWVTRLQGNKMTLTGHSARGAGDFYAHVQGMATRSSKTANPRFELADAALMPGTTARMQPLESMVGTYKFTGWMIPMPGMPKTEISGTETAAFLFGGTVMELRMKGDPIPSMPGIYQQVAYLAWNAHDRCYRFVTLNNMGEILVDECRAAGDRKLIMTSARLQRGQPAVVRYVLELDDDGAMTRIYTDQIIADGKPTRVFEGTYEQQKS